MEKKDVPTILFLLDTIIDTTKDIKMRQTLRHYSDLLETGRATSQDVQHLNSYLESYNQKVEQQMMQQQHRMQQEEQKSTTTTTTKRQRQQQSQQQSSKTSRPRFDEMI